MGKRILTNRDQLSELWLPWCVDVSHPAIPLDDFPATKPNAAQVRITDLGNEQIQTALARQRTPSGNNSWPKITAFAASFSAVSPGGQTIVVKSQPPDEPMVMEFDEFKMLCEGCHRACGLWVAGIASFELHVSVSETVWSDYRAPELRARGRPFGTSTN